MLEKKIETNNIINSKLEFMTKTIYDYWFLQFEFPDENGKPYKSSGGKMIWNEELKKSIPYAWEVKPFINFGELLMGQSPNSTSYNEDKRGKPLINGAAELQKDKIEISKYTDKPTRVCRTNDLIFCIRATIGNLRYADRDYCLGRGVAAFTPKTKEYSEYLYFVIKDILKLYNKILTGSIIVGITKDDFEKKSILLPNKDILKSFSEISYIMINTLKKNEKENQELISLRDFLLPMLMNGQVTFKEFNDEINIKDIQQSLKEKIK